MRRRRWRSLSPAHSREPSKCGRRVSSSGSHGDDGGADARWISAMTGMVVKDVRRPLDIVFRGYSGLSDGVVGAVALLECDGVRGGVVHKHTTLCRPSPWQHTRHIRQLETSNENAL